MPIHHMLYRCPRCGHDPVEGNRRGAECSSCGTRYEQGRDSVIVVSPPDGPPEQASAETLLAQLEEMPGPGLCREALIRLGRSEGQDVVRWRGEVLGFAERISWKGTGFVRLEGDDLTFRTREDAARAEGFACSIGEIRGVQISARALQLTLDRGRLYQLEFIRDSPKRWEDLLCRTIRRFHARSGLSVAEFKPRVVTTAN